MRLLAELRVYGKLYRPPHWLFPGVAPHKPMPIGTAQRIYYHAKRTTKLTHGKDIYPLHHGFATHLLEASVDICAIQLLLGHRSLDTTTRYLSLTRQHLGQIRSPLDLLHCNDLPLLAME